MPRLVPDLEARLVRYEVHVEKRRRVKAEVLAVKSTGPYTDDEIFEDEGPVAYIPEAGRLEEADGVWFLCPKCFAENGGPVGTHAVLCWFVGRVLDDIDPKPGRWTPSGTGLHDLTFVPGAGRTQSVLLTGGCGWHGFVTNGDVA